VQSQITSVQVKFLSGADNIERWTNQIHWDFILKNVKVVVSTYQILLEGLGHGFIHMKRLAMIVFDEGLRHLYYHRAPPADSTSTQLRRKLSRCEDNAKLLPTTEVTGP
jgi:ERCC4-related helicase